jgi:hypothetical protein
MPEQGNALSRNPNVCASCSSMSDGMEDSNLPESIGVNSATFAEDQPQAQTATARSGYVSA